MAISNSVNPLQETNLTSFTKTAGDNKSAGAGADFAQQLAQASSTLNAAGAVSSIKDAVVPAMDINSNFNNSSVSSSALDANGFLSQTLRNGIEEQFNKLGNEIAASFIAGLAGQDSATAGSAETGTSEQAVSATKSTTGETEESDSELSAAAETAEGVTAESSAEGLQAASESAASEATAEDSSAIGNIFSQAFHNLLDALPSFSPLADKETNNSDEQQASSSEEQTSSSQDEELTTSLDTENSAA
jgi:hypothetical protein